MARIDKNNVDIHVSPRFILALFTVSEAWALYHVRESCTAICSCLELPGVGKDSMGNTISRQNT